MTAKGPRRGGIAAAPLVAVIVAGGLLASCSASQKTKFSEAEYGVPASPRVVARGRIPEGGGRYMVGKPYRVAGKTYVPRDDPNYKAVGLASWYGPNFHGRKTANGEVYDMRDLSAAHPTMPLPSYARVTNLKNGRSLVVRVNDRGPFKHGRVIDVSQTAAEMLDFQRTGIAKVRVEYVGPARLDGHDRRILMATYREPGQAPATTMIASARPNAPQPRPVQVASATRIERTVDFSIADPATAVAPRVDPRLDDPLAPLILQTAFASASSYLPADRLPPAHDATAQLAAAGSAAALGPAVAAPQAMSGENVTVQVGTFADAANAERAGRLLERFGAVGFAERNGLTVVNLHAPRELAPAAIAAADAAGLAGAFIASD